MHAHQLTAQHAEYAYPVLNAPNEWATAHCVVCGSALWVKLHYVHCFMPAPKQMSKALSV